MHIEIFRKKLKVFVGFLEGSIEETVWLEVERVIEGLKLHNIVYLSFSLICHLFSTVCFFIFCIYSQLFNADVYASVLHDLKTENRALDSTKKQISKSKRNKESPKKCVWDVLRSDDPYIKN